MTQKIRKQIKAEQVIDYYVRNKQFFEQFEPKRTAEFFSLDYQRTWQSPCPTGNKTQKFLLKTEEYSCTIWKDFPVHPDARLLGQGTYHEFQEGLLFYGYIFSEAQQDRHSSYAGGHYDPCFHFQRPADFLQKPQNF